jgi:hypothetical protein
VESTPTAESITHSRPQIITGQTAGFRMRIGLATQHAVKYGGTYSGIREENSEVSS